MEEYINEQSQKLNFQHKIIEEHENKLVELNEKILSLTNDNIKLKESLVETNKTIELINNTILTIQSKQSNQPNLPIFNQPSQHLNQFNQPNPIAQSNQIKTGLQPTNIFQENLQTNQLIFFHFLILLLINLQIKNQVF